MYLGCQRERSQTKNDNDENQFSLVYGVYRKRHVRLARWANIFLDENTKRNRNDSKAKQPLYKARTETGRQ